MIRRTTWRARLLSVATGPLILYGCATRTGVLDADTARGGIAAQPGRRGLVIAAPHGTSDVRTADIAADLGRRTGFGVVIASGFAIESDTHERRWPYRCDYGLRVRRQLRRAVFNPHDAR